jgi:hypothetical protein
MICLGKRTHYYIKLDARPRRKDDEKGETQIYVDSGMSDKLQFVVGRLTRTLVILSAFIRHYRQTEVYRTFPAFMLLCRRSFRVSHDPSNHSCAR